jgi:hypothetical protein
MTNKEELRKCLENLEVDGVSADKFVESLTDIYQQLLDKDVRMSHPSLLKMRYLVEEILATFEGGTNKVLASSTYSSPKAQMFADLNDALVIQIEKARQMLKG